MSTKAIFATALMAVAAMFSTAFAQQWIVETATATVPVKVNVAADVVFAPITGASGTEVEGNVTANVEKNFNIGLSGGYVLLDSDPTKVPYLPSRNAGVQVKYNRGNVNLSLPAQSYSNAVISLYSINGKRVLSGDASKSISSSNVPMGVYLLSVKGANGKSFTTRLTHNGNRLNINATFAGMDNTSLNALNKVGDYGRWTITVSAPGYFTETRTIWPDEGTNPIENFTLRQPATNTKADFTETVGNVSFNMVYVPGGTFTIGCGDASSTCPADAKTVSGVKVSNYYIGKATVTAELWNAVVGGATCNQYYPKCTDPYGSMTWYDAMEFACKLSQKTGRNYRMTTEAEWEYAAKNHLSKLSGIGGGTGMGGEEWAYNSWLSTHAGGDDPVGPSSGAYTQKTRRDPNGTVDNITGRLIRSVEGIGPELRLAISADTDYPPGYVSPCNLHMPKLGPEPVNTYRDPRWVTGSDARWTTGSIALGTFDLRVWDDGTAKLGNTDGQWFTSNNIAFVFVPNSGSITKYAYIFLNEIEGSLISDKAPCYYGCTSPGGYVGRMAKEPASSITKPNIPILKTGAELAAAAGNDYKMLDMANIPQTAREKDSRLLDGTSHGWFQDNRQAGGVHHYRKDVDADEFRFTVNQGSSRTILANGDWFTVNNTFLRVTHSSGYTADYLYAVDSDGTFYHNSFMAYERGDFRMFKKTANNSDVFNATCGSLCSGEIPKGEGASIYASQGETGKSTFTPAPCPPEGCQ